MKENKVSNLFRANTDSISDVNKRNILSTWKTILGGKAYQRAGIELVAYKD